MRTPLTTIPNLLVQLAGTLLLPNSKSQIAYPFRNPTGPHCHHHQLVTLLTDRTTIHFLLSTKLPPSHHSHGSVAQTLMSLASKHLATLTPYHPTLRRQPSHGICKSGLARPKLLLPPQSVFRPTFFPFNAHQLTRTVIPAWKKMKSLRS